MKYNLKGMLALILALSMSFSLLGVSVWAAETEGAPNEAEVFHESDDSSQAEDELPAESAFLEEEVVEESVTEEAMMANAGSGTENDPYVVTTWEELRSKMSEGGHITLGNDITAPSGAAFLDVPSGKTVVLDLNDKKLDRGLSSQTTNGYVIKNSGNLTIKDTNPATTRYYYIDSAGLAHVVAQSAAEYTGAADESRGIFVGGYITGGNNSVSQSDYGGCILNKKTITMESGTIIGNRANTGNGYAGGICNDGVTSLTMNGGQIIGNVGRWGGGIALLNGATFTLNNGTIKQNHSVRNGGAIQSNSGANTINICGGTITNNYVENNNRAGSAINIDQRTTLNLSGSPYIIGNKSGSNKVEDNIYHNNNGGKIYVDALNSSDKSIGVNINGGAGTFTEAGASA